MVAVAMSDADRAEAMHLQRVAAAAEARANGGRRERRYVLSLWFALVKISGVYGWCLCVMCVCVCMLGAREERTACTCTGIHDSSAQHTHTLSLTHISSQSAQRSQW